MEPKKPLEQIIRELEAELDSVDKEEEADERNSDRRTSGH